MRLKAIIFILVLVPLASFSQTQEDIDVIQASKIIEGINPQDTIKTVILDVRTKKEYDDGHIPGAIMIDFYSDDFKNQIKVLDKSNTYLIYCKSGYRSKKTFKLMKQEGFAVIYNIKGGFDSWAKKK